AQRRRAAKRDDGWVSAEEYLAPVVREFRDDELRHGAVGSFCDLDDNNARLLVGLNVVEDESETLSGDLSLARLRFEDVLDDVLALPGLGERPTVGRNRCAWIDVC